MTTERCIVNNYQHCHSDDRREEESIIQRSHVGQSRFFTDVQNDK